MNKFISFSIAVMATLSAMFVTGADLHAQEQSFTFDFNKRDEIRKMLDKDVKYRINVNDESSLHGRSLSSAKLNDDDSSLPEIILEFAEFTGLEIEKSNRLFWRGSKFTYEPDIVSMLSFNKHNSYPNIEVKYHDFKIKILPEDKYCIDRIEVLRVENEVILNNNGYKPELHSDEYPDRWDKKNYTWTAPDEDLSSISLKFTYEDNASPNNNFVSIPALRVVYHEVKSEVEAEAPVITSDYNLVTISAADGANVYYTTDGSDPKPITEDLYSSPFSINESTTVKAIAATDGTDISKVATHIAEYIAPATATWKTVKQDNENAQSGNVTDPIFHLDGMHDGVLFAINAPEGHTLWYSLTQDNGSDINHSPARAGQNTDTDYTSKTIELTSVPAGSVEDVLVQRPGVLKYYAQHPTSGKYSHITQVTFSGHTGIESVITDQNSNQPIEFYNLQGHRITNPTHGLYLFRRGHTVTKVLIK